MSSKYVDTTAIVQVIGSVYNDLSILEDDDKYVISEDDFPNEFHKVVFGSIYKLYELGSEKVSLENINDFLASRPKSEAIYKSNKGDEWLLRAAEAALPESFNYYYNRMKKFTLLRAYDNVCGSDMLKDIYDVDNILDIKKKQLQEELLDNATLEEIANKIDDKIEQIKIKYVDNTMSEAVQAGEGIDEVIERFKQYPEVGIPLYGSMVNSVYKGARLKKFYLRSAPSGLGKALPNYAILPTPSGPRQVKDIKVGDYLFGRDGKPTKVLARYPQPTKKLIWKMHLWGEIDIECCGEHLWEVIVEDGEPQVLETKKIAGLLRERKKVEIRLCEPVEYPAMEDGIDLYDISCLREEYLRASVEQRRAIVQNRMDCFGYVARSGSVAYHSNKEEDKLMKKFCRSLGYAVADNPIGPGIVVQGSKEKRDLLFRERKINFEDDDDYYKKDTVRIYSVDMTNMVANMTCFTVDNDDHLFLTEHMIPTHNTRTMVADACYIACDRIYDDQFGWVSCGPGQPTLYITTEQELEEVQTMALAFVSNVNEDHILKGWYDEGEEERVREAAQIIKNAPLYIEELPDFSLLDVENTIKQNIREKGVFYVVHDYIHTSMKILEEITRRSGGVRLREDNILFMLSTRLKDICNKYGVFILSATQLSGNYMEAETPDQNLLRGKTLSLCLNIPYSVLLAEVIIY